MNLISLAARVEPGQAQHGLVFHKQQVNMGSKLIFFLSFLYQTIEKIIQNITLNLKDIKTSFFEKNLPMNPV